MDRLDFCTPELKVRNKGKVIEIQDDLTYCDGAIVDAIAENFAGKEVKLTLQVTDMNNKGIVLPCKTITIMSDLIHVLRSIDRQISSFNDKLTSINSEIQDILHFIELNDFNRNCGNRLAKLLKQKRQERREVKDSLAKLMGIKNFADKHPYLAKDLSEVVNFVQAEIKHDRNRTYTERRSNVAEYLGLATVEEQPEEVTETEQSVVNE